MKYYFKNSAKIWGGIPKNPHFWAVFLKMFLQVKIVAAVEVAVAYGFHDVVLANLDAALEVGDGAGDFQPESVN